MYELEDPVKIMSKNIRKDEFSYLNGSKEPVKRALRALSSDQKFSGLKGNIMTSSLEDTLGRLFSFGYIVTSISETGKEGHVSKVKYNGSLLNLEKFPKDKDMVCMSIHDTNNNIISNFYFSKSKNERSLVYEPKLDKNINYR